MNAINLYHVERWLYLHKATLFAKLFQGLIFLFYNSFVPYTCSIGDGSKLGYKGIGVVIHKRAVIGKNCIIGTNVTIGGKSGYEQVPVIGDNCYIGSGAKVLGPIKIGNNVVIGANAVMLKDAPDNTVWAGVPAKCIKERITQDYIV